MAASSPSQLASRPLALLICDSARWHRIRVRLAWLAALAFLTYVAIYGYHYYRLDLPARLLSPQHRILRPSGVLGLRLGMLGVAMFAVIYLYAIRKRWPWLGRIGSTKNWLDYHVVLGITAPIVITLHSSFKLRGLAGVAYWIMIAVALSGVVGRYLYQQIPRHLSSAELSLKEMEAALETLGQALARQSLLPAQQIAALLRLPGRDEVGRMSVVGALWLMLRLDVQRQFHVARLRRRSLPPLRRWLTLGGWAVSGQAELEEVISAVREQAYMSTKLLFLGRIQALFHLWHVVHRPFSYSFAVLVALHIAMVLALGYY